MADDTSTSLQADSTGEYEPVRPRPHRVSFCFGAESHVGKVRARNEDHYLIARLCKSMRICETNLVGQGTTRFADEEGYLMVVADGMGGVSGGDQASRMAIESVEDFVLNAVKWFLHLGGDDESELKAELREALKRADRMILQTAQDHASLAGMGTTLTVAFSVGDDLFIAHAGDSRAYIFRDGSLFQITNDHTLVQLLIESGRLSPEEARRYHRRNVVTNVVGGPIDGVSAEIHKVRLEDGDIVLLCSDGLTELVKDAEIAETLAAHASDPHEACRRLVEQALEGGGPDNVTVLVGRYHIDAPA